MVSGARLSRRAVSPQPTPRGWITAKSVSTESYIFEPCPWDRASSSLDRRPSRRRCCTAHSCGENECWWLSSWEMWHRLSSWLPCLKDRIRSSSFRWHWRLRKQPAGRHPRSWLDGYHGSEASWQLQVGHRRQQRQLWFRLQPEKKFKMKVNDMNFTSISWALLSSTSIRAAGWRTFIRWRIVAPSLVIVTLPLSSLIILSIPLGPREVRTASATALAASMLDIRI